ncbi:N-acyl-D-aspartate/D-glutamate deacylase [Microbispora rosea subsp. aerata]|nr:amidohydrolase family protein [Microbispora rosea]GGO11567.1 N-acyl-D-aspartate/D-glutamate deacylase [Microbispora rosea subsp. aerata]GIH55746.1 N-acyl-D-aspartate/D-glutamate deacylase [Microbispora rosea subsp. aerata]GLJ85956.1 N-acyl-D-aspartate/D-glutamate deacylase [Microbispora rosea subsp. aerata]
MTFDVLISGGRVVDGTGAPAFRADVGVRGGVVEAVGRLDAAEAAVRIDAAGRYVLPGLVDCHAHGDAAVFDPRVQHAALRQGVTTFVLGQDGLSFAPTTSPEAFAYASGYFAAINGAHPHVDGPVSVGELLDAYDGRTALNTVYLLPHGTIRFDVMGPAERAADEDETRAMLRRVETGLADGAAGLSSGLEYAPGRYADAAELAALCAPLGDLPYVTHMRGYGASAPVGMAEVVEIARRSGAVVHVSHLHGPASILLPLVEDARRQDVDLTFDTYPYLRASTILAMVTLPPWVPAADPDRAVAMLSTERERLAEEWAGRDDLWPRITLSHAPGFEWAEGMTLPAAAAEYGATPAEFCRVLLVKTRLQAGCVQARPDEGPTGEESVRAVMRDPGHTGGSDGIYMGGHPHPRGFGAFARYLGRHVRELGDLTWEQAAVHLASHPARRFRLPDRGLVRRGQVADLVVVDPATVADTATYEEPRSLAVGVDDVLVGGVPVLRGGELTGATPGRALRP